MVSKLFSWGNYTHTPLPKQTKQKNPNTIQKTHKTLKRLQQGLQNSRSANIVHVGQGPAVRFTNNRKSRRVLAARKVLHKAHMPLPCRTSPKGYLAWPRNQFIEILEPVLFNDWVKWKRNKVIAIPISYLFRLGKKGFICLGGFMNVWILVKAKVTAENTLLENAVAAVFSTLQWKLMIF